MNAFAHFLWIQRDSSGESPVPFYVRILNIGIAVLVMTAIVFLSLYSLHYNWGWSGVWERRMLLWQGWLTTLLISMAALVTSTVAGLVLALLSRTTFLPVRYAAQSYIEIIRASPLLVLILLVWYGFGGVFHWPSSYRFPAAIFILTIFESAYISQIIRAGIESISKTQLEAAMAVGFTRYQTYRYVIGPQSIRQILPPLAGEFISLTKNSSLLYVISIPELTQNAQQINSETYSTLETYLPLAVGYWVINLPISLFSRWLEAYFKYET